MDKFYGPIGFSKTVETSPDAFETVTHEHEYFGDVLTAGRRWNTGGQVNANLGINCTIQIIADDFAIKNHHLIKYVEFKGTRWSVSSITVSTPTRLDLVLGEIYNGK